MVLMTRRQLGKLVTATMGGAALELPDSPASVKLRPSA